jgi:hypothetical protein
MNWGKKKHTIRHAYIYICLNDWLEELVILTIKIRIRVDMYVLWRKLNEMHLSSNDSNWLVISFLSSEHSGTFLRLFNDRQRPIVNGRNHLFLFLDKNQLIIEFYFDYVQLNSMEYKHQTVLIWQTFVCLLLFLVNRMYKFSSLIKTWREKYFSVNAYTDPEIISTQDEIITYVNHTAKLSCIIQNRNRQHVRNERKQFDLNWRINLGHMVSC